MEGAVVIPPASALGNLDRKLHLVVLGGANDVECAGPIEHEYRVLSGRPPAAGEEVALRE